MSVVGYEVEREAIDMWMDVVARRQGRANIDRFGCRLIVEELLHPLFLAFIVPLCASVVHIAY